MNLYKIEFNGIYRQGTAIVRAESYDAAIQLLKAKYPYVDLNEIINMDIISDHMQIVYFDDGDE